MRTFSIVEPVEIIPVENEPVLGISTWMLQDWITGSDETIGCFSIVVEHEANNKENKTVDIKRNG